MYYHLEIHEKLCLSLIAKRELLFRSSLVLIVRISTAHQLGELGEETKIITALMEIEENL